MIQPLKLKGESVVLTDHFLTFIFCGVCRLAFCYLKTEWKFEEKAESWFIS